MMGLDLRCRCFPIAIGWSHCLQQLAAAPTIRAIPE